MRTLLLSSSCAALIALQGCAQPPAAGTALDPLHCDTVTGACTIPGLAAEGQAPAGHAVATTKPITVLYFTDPICSSCWGSEPQLRRLKMEYGDVLDVQVHMGGLLPSWDGFNGGGIRKPADVAAHWDDVSPHYRMPIIGDVWLEDPLPSSHPPSIAFKAAELQDPSRAEVFLRRLREQVLVEKRNIARWPVIAEAATFAGLDTARLHADLDGPARALFEADLTLARSLGVRGFPTFILSDAQGGRQVVYGARPYAQFTAAVKALAPAAQPTRLPADVDGLFQRHASWCAEEVAVALDIPHAQARALLERAEAEGRLTAVHTRNGSVWRRK